MSQEGGDSSVISIMNQTPILAVDRAGSYTAVPGFCVGFLMHGRKAELVATTSQVGKAPRLRDERSQAQAEQWKRAFSGSSLIARTAHVAATDRGEPGPYPWRQPV